MRTSGNGRVPSPSHWLGRPRRGSRGESRWRLPGADAGTAETASTLSWGSRDWMLARVSSCRYWNGGRLPGPMTSDDATTEGMASETGRKTSSLALLSASAVSGLPGSPATMIMLCSTLIKGWSFLESLNHALVLLPFGTVLPLGAVVREGLEASARSPQSRPTRAVR